MRALFVLSIVFSCVLSGISSGSRKKKGRGKKSKKRIAEISDMEANTLSAASATDATTSAAEEVPEGAVAGKLGSHWLYSN